MLTLNLDLGARSYPIHIGPDLLKQTSLFEPAIKGRQVFVVTNSTVAPLYLDTVLATLEQYDVQQLVLPDGEEHKTMASMETVIGTMLEHRYDRSACAVALGGGVIGDLVGFSAACYQRGIDFIQLPTTLLSQVDASVGGKTAVNHALGKNMIGAFHQPRAVIIDTNTLHTLPAREFAAGLAEIVKYGLIRDREFFDWLEENTDKLLGKDEAALSYAIERSCQNKAQVVAADERESGQRALLNLGHTFGHAIETGLGYGQWLHGEAVAAGMCVAADLSVRLGWLGRDSAGQIEHLLKHCNLPTRIPSQLTAETMLDLMKVDKKALAGVIRLILLRDIGEAIVTGDYDQALMMQSIEHMRE